MSDIIRNKGKFMTNISPVKAQIPNMIRLFKRRFVSHAELDAMLVNISPKERNLGSLPYDWFPKDLPRKKYAKFSQKVFGVLGNFAKEVKSDMHTPISCFSSHLEELENKLRSLLGKNAKAEFFDEGSLGKIFRMIIGGDKGKKYAIKIFHLGERVEGHGKSKEIANAINYCHTTKKSQHAQFYFGRIAGKKNYDGFIVTEFLPGESEYCFHVGPRIEYNRFSLFDAMDGRNKKGGKLFDFGDMERKYSSKKAEKIAKQLIEALKRSDYKAAKQTLTNTKGLAERDEVIAKILQDAPIDPDICTISNICPEIDYTSEQTKILKLFDKVRNKEYSVDKMFRFPIR